MTFPAPAFVGTLVAPFSVMADDYAVRGVDISVYQGAVNWDILKTKAHFVYIRAGLGNDSLDYNLDQNVCGAALAGIPFGLYWVMKPDKDWTKHAASFAAVVDGYDPLLPPVWDIELSGGLGKSALDSWLFKAINRFYEKTGLISRIYTAAGFWNRYLPLTSWAWRLPLWVANYTTASAPLLPLEWSNHNKTWEFWQHSADGNGLGAEYGVSSVSIDLNRYNGTIAQFNAAFGANIQPLPGDIDPEPTPEIEPAGSFTVSSAYRNIRSAPDTGAAIIGNAQRGSVLPFTESAGEWRRVEGWVWKAANE